MNKSKTVKAATAKTTTAKAATAKTTTAKSVKREAVAESASVIKSALVAAMKNRALFAESQNNASLQDKCNKLAARFELSEAVIAELCASHAMTETLTQCAARLAITSERDANFIAIYTAQKIEKIMRATASKVSSALDNFSRSIVSNLVAFNQLNNKSTLAALSSKVVFDSTDSVVKVKRLCDCAVSTATTQAASTRHALAALDFVSVTKYAKDDVMKLNENAQAATLRTMFAKTA